MSTLRRKYVLGMERSWHARRVANRAELRNVFTSTESCKQFVWTDEKLNWTNCLAFVCVMGMSQTSSRTINSITWQPSLWSRGSCDGSASCLTFQASTTRSSSRYCSVPDTSTCLNLPTRSHDGISALLLIGALVGGNAGRVGVAFVSTLIMFPVPIGVLVFQFMTLRAEEIEKDSVRHRFSAIRVGS